MLQNHARGGIGLSASVAAMATASSGGVPVAQAQSVVPVAQATAMPMMPEGVAVSGAVAAQMAGLNAAFANGQIDQMQFEAAKANLLGPSSAQPMMGVPPQQMMGYGGGGMPVATATAVPMNPGSSSSSSCSASLFA